MSMQFLFTRAALSANKMRHNLPLSTSTPPVNPNTEPTYTRQKKATELFPSLCSIVYRHRVVC